jgi:3-isopropylmalate/(R)-2-methylmalate dehydratase large subunit
MGLTLFDKIWNNHLVGVREDGRELLYIDQHVVHDLHAPHAFKALARQNSEVRRKDLTVVVQDHTVATLNDIAVLSENMQATQKACLDHKVTLIDHRGPQHGISHIISVEQGWALPGKTLACPDSHASTVGALGCLAFGCGTTELVHILATQTMALVKPQQMRVLLTGHLRSGVNAKDVALHLIRTLGVTAGRGYAVEYAGPVIEDMDLEGRMTLCNMTIEWGGRTCLIAPDAKTVAWYEAQGLDIADDVLRRVTEQSGRLHTDPDARFDAEFTLDCSAVRPQITWGTDPSQTVNIHEEIPLPQNLDADQKMRLTLALDYMGLKAGQTLKGLPVQRVFIGSCTNARLSDLREAARVVQNRHVADNVVALVVPGSSKIKAQAEAEGIDRVFINAGFQWHSSGCSMCAGANGEVGLAGERCVATSNRNFENRQGRDVRTHLASPATAAASAIAGCIVDAEDLKDLFA